jgi:hypothetical protein
MTLFDQCVEAAAWADHEPIANYERITRAVLETIRDHTPSPRTVDEMCRVLGGDPYEGVDLSTLPPRIGPNCEVVVGEERW